MYNLPVQSLAVQPLADVVLMTCVYVQGYKLVLLSHAYAEHSRVFDVTMVLKMFTDVYCS